MYHVGYGGFPRLVQRMPSGFCHVLVLHLHFPICQVHKMSCLLMYSFIQIAKRYVESALDYSKDILIGGGHQGPFDHFMKLKNDAHQPFDPSSLLLYAVTDSRMNKKWGRSMSDAVKAAIEGGATIIQLRFVLNALMHFFFLVYIYVPNYMLHFLPVKESFDHLDI